MYNLFDLNIEKVLDNWDVEHAVREIIANALDEQKLTNTQDIKIYKQDEKWHIRDFGRGLQDSHFTQNENQEKLSSPFVIGKFGVGLKDALAVFHRKGINVEINSKFGHIRLKMAEKSGFNIQTLHAIFEDSIDESFIGTDFVLSGVSDLTIEKAKSMFLCFNDGLELLDTTKYGEVYKRRNSSAVIYINGVQVATEENFLFSYNITNINSKIKKALNRERSNVGRSAYSDTIKNILLQCKSHQVLTALVEDLEKMVMGENFDETKWGDVSTYAAKTLSEIENENVVFMTPSERGSISNQEKEILEESGKRLVLVPDKVYEKTSDCVPTFENVVNDYNNTFSYDFVNVGGLTSIERETFELSRKIVNFLKRNDFKFTANIKISETIRIGLDDPFTKGVYSSSRNEIIILRKVLQDKTEFCRVLLHEFAHSQNDHSDNTRDFERDLTNMLGSLFVDFVKSETNHQ